MIFEIKLIFFVVSIQELISLESYFKIDQRVNKLLSVEMFDNIFWQRFKASVKHYNEMACRQLKYPCVLEKE